eukprot:12885775-Prorocentrum_lima.AAC.1
MRLTDARLDNNEHAQQKGARPLPSLHRHANGLGSPWNFGGSTSVDGVAKELCTHMLFNSC